VIQAVCHKSDGSSPSLPSGARIQCHKIPYEICSGRSGISIGFAPKSLAVLANYLSNIAPYLLISFGGWTMDPLEVMFPQTDSLILSQKNGKVLNLCPVIGKRNVKTLKVFPLIFSKNFVNKSSLMSEKFNVW
jgi:hypothetical protein